MYSENLQASNAYLEQQSPVTKFRTENFRDQIHLTFPLKLPMKHISIACPVEIYTKNQTHKYEMTVILQRFLPPLTSLSPVELQELGMGEGVRTARGIVKNTITIKNNN